MLSWECKSDESPQEFAALKAYLEMGEDRTIKKVAEKCGKSASMLEHWSSQHHWVERSKDYDSWEAQQVLVKNAKDKERFVSVQLSIASAFQELVMKQLKRYEKIPEEELKKKFDSPYMLAMLAETANALGKSSFSEIQNVLEVMQLQIQETTTLTVGRYEDPLVRAAAANFARAIGIADERRRERARLEGPADMAESKLSGGTGEIESVVVGNKPSDTD